MNNFLFNMSDFFRANPFILVLLGIWELSWKGIALWKAGRNNQRSWFVAILIANTVGILPMIYLKFFQEKLKVKK